MGRHLTELRLLTPSAPSVWIWVQEEAQHAQVEVRDLEDMLITTKMKLAEAEYERGMLVARRSAPESK